MAKSSSKYAQKHPQGPVRYNEHDRNYGTVDRWWPRGMNQRQRSAQALKETPSRLLYYAGRTPGRGRHIFVPE